MKKCVKCKIEKDWNRFTKRQRSKDGLHPYCKECVSGIMKVYGEKEEVKKRSKEWKKNNKEQIKVHAKKTYEKHKYNRCEKVRKYNEENREKINARQKEYYAKNRKSINEKQRIFLRSKEGNLKSKEYYYRTKEKFDIKIKARNKLRYAVKIGKIMKAEKCEKCFEKIKLHGHHYDYSKPLEVIWVCNYCHKKIHSNIGN